MSHFSYVHHLCAGRLPGSLPGSCFCLLSSSFAAAGLISGESASWPLGSQEMALSLLCKDWDPGKLQLCASVSTSAKPWKWGYEKVGREPKHALLSSHPMVQDFSLLNIFLLMTESICSIHLKIL